MKPHLTGPAKPRPVSHPHSASHPSLARSGSTLLGKRQLIKASTLILGFASMAALGITLSSSTTLPVAALAADASSLTDAPALAGDAAGASPSGSAVAEGSLPVAPGSQVDVPFGDDALDPSKVVAAPEMHGESDLVSELVGNGRTYLVTPHYTLAVPDESVPDGLTWDYAENIEAIAPDGLGATAAPLDTDIPLPAGATGILVVHDRASANVVAAALCVPDADLPAMEPGESVEGYSVIAGTTTDDPLSDGPANVIVLAPEAHATAAGNPTYAQASTATLPYLTSTGSLSQVHGIAPGQASRDAYVAWAEQEQGGLRIHTRGYSVLVPSGAMDVPFASFYLGDTEAPEHTDELTIQLASTELTIFQASTPDLADRAQADEHAQPVATTPSGATIMLAVTQSPNAASAPTDPATYVPWVLPN